MSELIGPYLEHLAAARASAVTIFHRRAYLQRSDDRLPCGIDAASGDELEAWIHQPDFAKWTMFTYYTHLASFYSWASDPRLLDYPLEFNPMQTVTRPPKPVCIPNPVSDAQASKAFAELTGPLLLAAKLAAYAGLRRAEICRADREHVTRALFEVPVGKGNRYGVVATSPILWDEVRDLPPGPLVRTADGGRWEPEVLGNAATYLLSKKILGENCGLHRFRHWFGTTIYRSTRDPLLTQKALRHASPDSTIGYILIADEERAAAVGALPNLLAA